MKKLWTRRSLCDSSNSKNFQKVNRSSLLFPIFHFVQMNLEIEQIYIVSKKKMLTH